MKENILFAYVHGSFLKDSFHDIDIAIYLRNRENTKTACVRYELHLEAKLQEQFHLPSMFEFYPSLRSLFDFQ